MTSAHPQSNGLVHLVDAPPTPGHDRNLQLGVTRFDDPGLFDLLSVATAAERDALPFGVVSMAPDGRVEHFNAAESRMAGLTASRVLGRNFFTSVAPCCNNFMVAHRFLGEAEIDATIDYVFTLRMAPQKVKLRMIKRAEATQMFLVCERRP